MSILGESNPEENNNNPPPAGGGGKYGGLKSNRKAKNRRDKVKFFDSADWAMRNQNQQGNADQDAEGNLPRANFQQIPDQDQDGYSVLANDSPLEVSALAGGNNNNESPLSGGDNNGQSPLSGDNDQSPLSGGSPLA